MNREQAVKEMADQPWVQVADGSLTYRWNPEKGRIECLDTEEQWVMSAGMLNCMYLWAPKPEPEPPEDIWTDTDADGVKWKVLPVSKAGFHYWVSRPHRFAPLNDDFIETTISDASLTSHVRYGGLVVKTKTGEWHRVDMWPCRFWNSHTVCANVVTGNFKDTYVPELAGVLWRVDSDE